MSDTPSSYVFFTCQPGAEGALKQELSARQPTWRLSFSRPGFVSFKTDSGAIEEGRLPVFARTRSVSLGRLDAPRLSDAAAALWQLPALVEMSQQNLPTTLHVWQRDTRLPGDDGFEPHITPLAEEVRQALRQSVPSEFAEKQQELPVARIGETVLDVVLVEPNQWWIGWHRATSRAERWPGGILPVAMPPHAVSRAYLKMAESLKWAALPVAAGDLWAEIGCAPGGASQALLDRGFHVLGIDPAEVEPAVAGHPHFAHVQKRVGDLRRSDLTHVRWLAADINQAPQYTLDAVERVVTGEQSSVRGLVLTLKLASWDLATAEQLDAYADRVRGWGYRDVRLKQLVHNRRELCLVALRSRGQRRVVRKRHQQRGKRVHDTGGRPVDPKPSAGHDPERIEHSPHARLAGPHFR
jgi:23S rRNA (cytidine2498-2'-O)-methyltransferase